LSKLLSAANSFVNRYPDCLYVAGAIFPGDCLPFTVTIFFFATRCSHSHLLFDPFYNGEQWFNKQQVLLKIHI
ncbi:MAG TPA: hypothetical protein VEZ17_01435, partial [Chitinophagaceae bacterium]|nr:hypothetical protein [Chitinophagaceae bacterium]